MTGRWLRGFGAPTRADVQLICFPHAGGAAGTFLPLARALGPAVDVRAVQYPGRQDRRLEPPLDSVEQLADRLAAILPDRPDLPYAFFGHSMGAVVAYETARRLERTPVRGPVRVFASGRAAPGSDRVRTVHLDGDDAIIADVRSLGGDPGGALADPDVRELALPALRADYRAVERYRWRPGTPLRAPVTVLVGESDPLVTTAEAAAWRGLSDGGADLRVLPGGHFYLDALVAEVAAAITARLLPVPAVPAVPAVPTGPTVPTRPSGTARAGEAGIPPVGQ